MASGFIILRDGRSLARRWTAYDYIIELVIDKLSKKRLKEADDFKNWLQALLPNPDDIYNGFGGFIRKDTGENVERWLDLRELTEENQQLFWESLQESLRELILDKQNQEYNSHIIFILKYFLRMKKLADIGDDPTNLSDWRDGYVTPSTNKKVGPGWAV